MVLFSERNGLAPEKILQDKDFDVTSRRLLANEIIKLFEICSDNHEALKQLDSFQDALIDYGITHAYWRHKEEAKKVLFFKVIKQIKYDYFEHIPKSENSHIEVSIPDCTIFFEKLVWKQTLDILELLIKNMGIDVLNDHFNNIFVKIGWAYKVTCDGQIIPTMDDLSFESLEETLSQTGKWEGVKTYVAKAVSFYKEGKCTEACIGMSEALDNMSKVIDGKESSYFSDMIRGQVKSDYKNPFPEGSPDWMKKLPAQLREKANGIYGFRNDYFGHGNGIENKVEESFAKWYLVSCSALINWMIEKHA
ncbi:MAG: AbiJ-NTD4 domain-containing protein [Vampirovibrionales bacterium]